MYALKNINILPAVITVALRTLTNSINNEKAEFSEKVSQEIFLHTNSVDVLKRKSIERVNKIIIVEVLFLVNIELFDDFLNDLAISVLLAFFEDLAYAIFILVELCDFLISEEQVAL